VKLHLFPAERGTGYVFENKIEGGSIPAKYIKPIDDGVREALTLGILAGCPVVDVRVELYGGSFHEVDSSEVTFKIAGSLRSRMRREERSPCCSNLSCSWR
jgi:elongation factor G